MKAAQMAAMEHMTGDVYRVGCDIERELNEANDRIKRLEDIISRAAYAFFRDGSDGQVASGMLTILEEVRLK
jgi:hypothetical protein